MPEMKTYHAPGIDLEHFGKQLAKFFKKQDLESQVLSGGKNVVTVQARQPKSWRSYVTGDSALSVQATRSGETLSVEIGSAKWADKVAGGVVALILFWPLAALPAWGAIKQKQVIDETEAWIQRYVATKGQGGKKVSNIFSIGDDDDEPEAETIACPACGEPLSPGAKFCANCGHKLGEKKACPSCGAALSPTAKFCENCGQKIEA